MNNLKQIISIFYRKIFPARVNYLKKALSGCKSVLDLGCGNNSPIQDCNISYSVGVEEFFPYIQESKNKKIHTEYIQSDIKNINFKTKSFDAVIILDVLEHLTKDDGRRLIKKIEKWAKKIVILSTPNGFISQNSYDDNLLQEHKSGWKEKDYKSLGFKVFGLDGWRKLRGSMGRVKYRPAFLWEIIADLTQIIIYHYPKAASKLFVIKKIN